MNPRDRSFYRKIAYLVAMALLLGVMFFFSRPATQDARGVKGSPGGLLAQMRAEHGLSQAQLGEIDPTSETIRLATLGMRGVAANLLWGRANEFKMKKDWTNLSATLNQLVKLQPNFIAVWRFQAWNLSYNVSVEFDDYRDRYHWVTRGIDFLMDGTEWNDRQPRLWWDIGWFIAQKIGRADEHRQYRRLFREDDEFHGRQALFHPPGRYPVLDDRDNWLVGKKWFLDTINLVDNHGASLGGLSPLLFRSDPPMTQINYSDAIQKEGVFGERALRAWNVAGKEWRDYGLHDIPTTFDTIIQLELLERDQETVDKLVAELDELTAGIREEIYQERYKALRPIEREAFETPIADRTDREHQLAADAREKLQISHKEVAARVPRPNREKAVKLAERVTELEERIGHIDRYRQIVNYAYWRLRCQVEQTPDAVDAREFTYRAEQALAAGNLPAAVDHYSEGFGKWRQVLDAHPGLLEDQTTVEDLMETIGSYRKLLDQLDQPLPDDFVLNDVISLHDKQQQMSFGPYDEP
ncbi:MAG: hypothetical protein RBS80_15025 [Thermoguttaceae bacterium]|jgi:hypothetical protein|nr:hypothetical protein [Thermoguttaceae bacterium]